MHGLANQLGAEAQFELGHGIPARIALDQDVER
jgi:hypothetical protein